VSWGSPCGEKPDNNIVDFGSQLSVAGFDVPYTQ